MLLQCSYSYNGNTFNIFTIVYTILLDNPSSSVLQTLGFNFMSTMFYSCKHRDQRINLELCGDILNNCDLQLLSHVYLICTFQSLLGQVKCLNSLFPPLKISFLVAKIYWKYAPACLCPDSFS